MKKIGTIMGVDVIIDDSMLPGYVKIKSDVDEKVIDLDGNEVIEEQS